MPDFGNLFSQLRSFRLEGRNRLIVTLIAVSVVISFIVVFLTSKGPQYGALYTDLSETDAAQIIERLKEDNVPYKLSVDGRTIQIPQDQVAEVKIDLAASGLPQGGGAGYELFDKSSFGETDFSQRMKYIRALQGELERLIRELNPVQSARVLLQIPEESIYLDAPTNPPTASVVVKLKPGAGFTRAQVKGIKSLVASSVAGMDSNDVKVVDVTGNLLSDKVGGSAQQNTTVSAVSTAQASLESRLQQSVETMLEQVLGPGRAVVRVTAEMDLDQLERKSERFEPVAGTNTGVVKSQSQVNENNSGTGTGGVTGLTANDGSTAVLNPGSTQTSGETSTKSETTTNYEVTHQEEKVVRQPGGIKRLTVSAVVDGVAPEDLESIRQVVISAAGIDERRGDIVSVESMEFANDDKTIAKQDETDKKGQGTQLVIPKELIPFMPFIGAGIAGLVLLAIIVRAISGKRKEKLLSSPDLMAKNAAKKDKRKKGRKGSEDETLPASGELLPLQPVTPDGVVAAVLQQAEAASGSDPSGTSKSEVIIEVEEQVKRDPKAAALIIRGWLSEED